MCVETFRRWELAAIAAAVPIFVLLRLPLVLPGGILLGWNSDAAVFGLMAKRIAAGDDFPIFFWGQSYMGPLTSYIAAPIGLLLPEGNWPLAVRLATWLECLGAIVFTWLGMRFAFGRATAAVVALLLAIAPVEIFRFNIAPIGAEQAYLMGAILFWYAARALARGGFRPREWLIFGLLSGLASWVNQTTIFVIAAALLAAFLSSEFWAAAWPEPRIADRLLLRRLDRLGWRQLDLATLILVRAIGYSLALAFLLGFLREWSGAVPAFFWRWPALEPLLALLLFHLAVELLFGTRLRIALREHVTRGPFLFALGFAIAYSPAFIAGLLSPWPPAAGWSAELQGLTWIPGKVARIVRYDFMQIIGAEPTLLGTAYAIVVAILLLLVLIRNRRAIADVFLARARQYGPQALCGLTILAAFIFYVTARRAYLGGARYVVVAVAPIFAFAFDGRRRIAAILAAAALIVAALDRVDRVVELRDSAIGWAMLFPERVDPRETLAAIERGGYRVCYADYWEAYKLQFLSDERVRFIPYEAYDRLPHETRLLAAEPGPRCFVERNGTVRDYRPPTVR